MSHTQLSWQVRLAAVLVGFGAVLGAGLVVVAFVLMRGDPGFLFAILPILFLVLSIVGASIALFSLALTTRLLKRSPGVRLQAAVLGGSFVMTGALMAPTMPAAGGLLALYGGALVWLMTTPGAARDLGSFARHPRQPAPWGSTPGTRIWSPAPQQQGPWSPDPTTLPWLTWKGATGPRPPWWQTWREGLAQGLPLWEALLLGLALAGFVIGMLSIPFGTFPVILGVPRGNRLPSWPVLLIPAATGVVWFVERRLRRRLADRR